MGTTKKTLITAALPYANGKIHVGHLAGCYLPADCHARFLKNQQKQTLFICGSDCYGVAITLKAELEGRTPLAHANYYHRINKELFEKMGISFDHFSHTMTEDHKRRTQEFFLDLLHNGYIEKKSIFQLYSEGEKRFLADRYVQGKCPKCHFLEARGDECTSCGASFEATDLIDPISKLTGSKLILKETEHYFLKLDLFKGWLQEWIADKNWKGSTLNFSKNLVKDLKPRCITRDLDWGVPLPTEDGEGKVLYVWFDAPIGYISATADLDPSLVKEYWEDLSVRYLSFIGKDNTVFHTLFFPAMIRGQNKEYKQVDEVIVNEFLNIEGAKFSKTAGNAIDLDFLLSKIQPDVLRFYLAQIAPEHQDADFRIDDLILRTNAELLGKVGNYCHRVMTFIYQKHEKKVPLLENLTKEDNEFIEGVKTLIQKGKEAYEAFSIKKASEILLELATLGNRYFDHQKPWSLAKKGEDNSRLSAVLSTAFMGVKGLAVLMYPIMPATALRLWHMMNIETVPFWDKGLETIVTDLKEPQPVFHKLEEIKSQEETKETSNCKPEIEFSDFEKVDLRVAKVLKCEKLAKSDRLLKFTLDVGGEERTILSGIASFVTDPHSLENRNVVIVSNLKPRKMMGIESQGMILSIVDENNQFELLTPISSNPGTQIR